MNPFVEHSQVVTTTKYNNVTDFHTNILSLFPLVFTIRFAVNKSSNCTLILLLICDIAVLQFNLQSGLNPSYRLSLYRHGTDNAENALVV
jgi:hypothetical protein